VELRGLTDPAPHTPHCTRSQPQATAKRTVTRQSVARGATSRSGPAAGKPPTRLGLCRRGAEGARVAHRARVHRHGHTRGGPGRTRCARPRPGRGKVARQALLAVDLRGGGAGRGARERGAGRGARERGRGSGHPPGTRHREVSGERLARPTTGTRDSAARHAAQQATSTHAKLRRGDSRGFNQGGLWAVHGQGIARAHT
jgi:hypothetical protein